MSRCKSNEYKIAAVNISSKSYQDESIISDYQPKIVCLEWELCGFVCFYLSIFGSRRKTQYL